MSLYALKPRFQALLRPLVGRLAASGVTANQVTIAAALGSVALGGLLLAGGGPSAWFLLLPLWLWACNSDGISGPGGDTDGGAGLDLPIALQDGGPSGPDLVRIPDGGIIVTTPDGGQRRKQRVMGGGEAAIAQGHEQGDEAAEQGGEGGDRPDRQQRQGSLPVAGHGAQDSGRALAVPRSERRRRQSPSVGSLGALCLGTKPASMTP